MTRPSFQSWVAWWVWHHPAAALADSADLRGFVDTWHRRVSHAHILAQFLAVAVGVPVALALAWTRAFPVLLGALALGALCVGLPALDRRIGCFTGLARVSQANEREASAALERAAPHLFDDSPHANRLWCYELLALVASPQGRQALEHRARHLRACALDANLPPASAPPLPPRRL